MNTTIFSIKIHTKLFSIEPHQMVPPYLASSFFIFLAHEAKATIFCSHTSNDLNLFYTLFDSIEITMFAEITKHIS